MDRHGLGRLGAALILLVIPLGAGLAGAVTGAVCQGGAADAAVYFDDGILWVGMDGCQGPLVEAPAPNCEEASLPGCLNVGISGKGGSDIYYERGGVVLCSAELNEGDTLVADPLSGSASLVSTVPGCAGSVEWTEDGIPGAGRGDDTEFEPNGDSVAAAAYLRLSRVASATGTISGEDISNLPGRFSRAYTVEAGAALMGGCPGLPPPFAC